MWSFISAIFVICLGDARGIDWAVVEWIFPEDGCKGTPAVTHLLAGVLGPGSYQDFYSNVPLGECGPYFDYGQSAMITSSGPANVNWKLYEGTNCTGSPISQRDLVVGECTTIKSANAKITLFTAGNGLDDHVAYENHEYSASEGRCIKTRTTLLPTGFCWSRGPPPLKQWVCNSGVPEFRDCGADHGLVFTNPEDCTGTHVMCKAFPIPCHGPVPHISRSVPESTSACVGATSCSFRCLQGYQKRGGLLCEQGEWKSTAECLPREEFPHASILKSKIGFLTGNSQVLYTMWARTFVNRQGFLLDMSRITGQLLLLCPYNVDSWMPTTGDGMICPRLGSRKRYFKTPAGRVVVNFHSLEALTFSSLHDSQVFRQNWRELSEENMPKPVLQSPGVSSDHIFVSEYVNDEDTPMDEKEVWTAPGFVRRFDDASYLSDFHVSEVYDWLSEDVDFSTWDSLCDDRRIKQKLKKEHVVLWFKERQILLPCWGDNNDNSQYEEFGKIWVPRGGVQFQFPPPNLSQFLMTTEDGRMRARFGHAWDPHSFLCFPGSSSVQTPTGLKALRDVRHADLVRVVLRNGSTRFEEIHTISHSNAITSNVYYRIETISSIGQQGNTITLASHNLMPACPLPRIETFRETAGSEYEGNLRKLLAGIWNETASRGGTGAEQSLQSLELVYTTLFGASNASVDNQSSEDMAQFMNVSAVNLSLLLNSALRNHAFDMFECDLVAAASLTRGMVAWQADETGALSMAYVFSVEQLVEKGAFHVHANWENALMIVDNHVVSELAVMSVHPSVTDGNDSWLGASGNNVSPLTQAIQGRSTYANTTILRTSNMSSPNLSLRNNNVSRPPIQLTPKHAFVDLQKMMGLLLASEYMYRKLPLHIKMMLDSKFINPDFYAGLAQEEQLAVWDVGGSLYNNNFANHSAATPMHARTAHRLEALTLGENHSALFDKVLYQILTSGVEPAQASSLTSWLGLGNVSLSLFAQLQVAQNFFFDSFVPASTTAVQPGTAQPAAHQTTTPEVGVFDSSVPGSSTAVQQGTAQQAAHQTTTSEVGKSTTSIHWPMIVVPILSSLSLFVCCVGLYFMCYRRKRREPSTVSAWPQVVVPVEPPKSNPTSMEAWKD